MSLGIEDTRPTFTGNSSTTVFPFTFTYTDSTDVEVYLDGVLQLSGYTVNASDVTFSSAPGTGVSVAIVRNTPLTQPNTYTDPETVTMEEFEGGLNRIVRMHQDTKGDLEQTPKAAPGDTPPGGSFVQAANTTIGQDSSGNLVMRSVDEQREHLGVQDISDDVSTVLIAASQASTSATLAATKAVEASDSATSAAKSYSNSKNALEDFASGTAIAHWIYPDPFLADPVITSDVVIQLQGAPPITLKASARPYTETNAMYALGNKVSSLFWDIVNILYGNVYDRTTDTNYGTADVMIDNYVPFTNWKTDIIAQDGTDDPYVTISYYGDETFTQALPAGLVLHNPDFSPYIAPQGLRRGISNLAPPQVTAGKGDPYGDPDAASVISATGITDDRGKNHYERIITGLKDLGLWSKIESGFLFGTNHQGSSTTIKPFKGVSNATGTGTNSDYWVSLDGVSNGYVVANANQTASDDGRTLVSIYTHDSPDQPCALVSNYQGGSAKGIALSVAGSSTGITGANVLDNIYLFLSTDGSTASVDITVDNANDGDWSFAASSYLDLNATLMGNSRQVVKSTAANAWINNANWGLGKNPNNSYFLDGNMAASIIFSEGLTNGELFKLRLLLESVLSDCIDFPPAVVWEGNSLTAQNSGGGTPLANKVMAETGWSDIRYEITAAGGAKQLDRVEPQYYNKVRRWVGANKARRVFWLWTGVNDITAGYSSADIIDSIKRTLWAAREDGFYSILVPLTPVASAGDGTSYQYSTAQQTVLSEVNYWIATQGAVIADQYLDINKIANEYPEFGDPTDSTYYTAGDGLHHNDAGRTLIKDYIIANVDLPTA